MIIQVNRYIFKIQLFSLSKVSDVKTNITPFCSELLTVLALWQLVVYIKKNYGISQSKG